MNPILYNFRVSPLSSDILVMLTVLLIVFITVVTAVFGTRQLWRCAAKEFYQWWQEWRSRPKA